MINEERQQLIENIIETNYYLTQSIIKNDKNKIQKYKIELDRLIDFILKTKIN